MTAICRFAEPAMRGLCSQNRMSKVEWAGVAASVLLSGVGLGQNMVRDQIAWGHVLMILGAAFMVVPFFAPIWAAIPLTPASGGHNRLAALWAIIFACVVMTIAIVAAVALR